MGILDFFSNEARQQRGAAMDQFGRDVGYYVPPNLRGLLGFAAEMTPSAALDRASQHSSRMLAPGRTPMERVGALGGMLSETAQVAAPVVVAGRAGMPAAQAVQEAFMGFSNPARSAGRVVVDRLNQPGPMPTVYSNPLLPNINPTRREVSAELDSVVDAMPSPYRVFHGGRDLIKNPRVTADPEGLLPGFSVTPSQSVAEMYASLRDGDAVSAFDIPRSSLNPIGELDLYNLQDSIEVRRGLDEGDLTEGELLAELKNRGFNAVEYSDPELGLRILDPSILAPVPSVMPAAGSKASEAIAQDILDLRAAGRADEVTEEMMAAADDTYMYFNTPLPMDSAARTARARTIGHNVDREFYRGGGTDRQALSADAGQFATQGTGVFMDPNPMRAETYGKMVAPLLTRSDAPIVSGDMSMFNRIEAPVYAWDRANDVDLPLIPRSGSTSTDDIARSARSQGLEAIEIQDITDPGPRRWRNEDGSIRQYPQFGTTRVEFDPTNIRSRFARFDPAFAHLRNLSAGVGGLGLLGVASGNQPTQGDGT